MSAKIEKVILDIHGKKIELTPEEARELKDALTSMFGGEKIVTIPQPYPVPTYPYPRPYWTWISPSWISQSNDAGTYTLSTKQ